MSPVRLLTMRVMVSTRATVTTPRLMAQRALLILSSQALQVR